MSHQENGFRLAIVVNGNEQRIINGNVYIPFGSEYSIRVVNNNSVRGKIKLTIDGISEDETFVINANDTITVSRFMCGNLSSGNAFKFVQKNDSRVTNPNNGSNGFINVQCWKEQVETFSQIIRKIKKPCIPADPYWHWYWKNDWSDHDQIFGGTPYKITCSTHNIDYQNVSYTLTNNVQLCSYNASQEGATVGGNDVQQKFYEVDDFPTEYITTNLSIKLLGRN